MALIIRSPRIGGRDTGSKSNLGCAAAAGTGESFLRPRRPPLQPPPEGGVSQTETEWRRRRLPRRVVVGVLAYLARSAATEMEIMLRSVASFK